MLASRDPFNISPPGSKQVATFINRHTPGKTIKPPLTFSPLAQILAGATVRVAGAAGAAGTARLDAAAAQPQKQDEGTAAEKTHQIRQGHSTEDVKEKDRNRSTTFNCVRVKWSSCCNHIATIESFVEGKKSDCDFT